MPPRAPQKTPAPIESEEEGFVDPPRGRNVSTIPGNAAHSSHSSAGALVAIDAQAGSGGLISQGGSGAGSGEGRLTLSKLILSASGGAAAAQAFKARALEWARTCESDPVVAALEAVGCALELAGLSVRVEESDLEHGPSRFIESLPERARDGAADPTVYPLLPKTHQGRKAVSSLERFWSVAVASFSGPLIAEVGTFDTLCSWMLAMSQGPIRALRHVATVTVLSIAEAMGLHCQALIRTRDTLHTQLAAVGSRNKRQQAQLERDATASKEHADKLYGTRSRLLEGSIPSRSRDVCEEIRLHTLCKVDCLMKQDPDMYLQNRWTARVFLMVHDPSAEVRLKALQVIQHWYHGQSYSDEVKNHLDSFVARCLSHVVERAGDVDSRVAAAALKCLRLPALAEKLADEEFDSIVNLCVGGPDSTVREEAALFINSHVFQDPGICVLPKRGRSGRGGGGAGGGGAGGGGGDDEDRDEGVGGGGGAGGEEPGARDGLRDLYDSETSLSMLMEFLESYMSSKMRITERAVGAFWPMAPALAHWSTMVNLCLVGESQQGAGLDPISPLQRLALLYIMEASVRRTVEDLRSIKPSERDAATAKLNDACAHIIPELPRLMKVCLSEERHCLLLSHVCKILVEYAVENTQHQVVVNPKSLCQWLEKFINEQSALDTTKYATDALVSLSRCFLEAKQNFLDLAKMWHHRCVKLLAMKKPGKIEDLRVALGRYIVLSNRAIDMTFAKPEVLLRLLELLDQRCDWMQASQAEADAARREADAARRAAAAEEPSTEAPAAPVVVEAVAPTPPAGVADARLALQLIEAATTTAMWYVKMAYFMEVETADAEILRQQLKEMSQDMGDFEELRGQLAPMVNKLRGVCARIVQQDRSPSVQFHAFSAYMSINQYALGVSDRLALELCKDGNIVASRGIGKMYEVKVPRPHLQALWNYVKGLYSRVTATESHRDVLFEAEGSRVHTTDVFPAPSQGTMTSSRYLTMVFMEAIGKGNGDGSASKSSEGALSPEHELFVAVLASRMIQESEVEDIYAGPLGLLLIVQCERGCPRAIREVALNFVRRLRNMARLGEDYALLHFRLQEKAIASLFDCAGTDSAHALCRVLVKQWGIKVPRELEMSFWEVLTDALLECITNDKRRLPLLDVFCTWIGKVDDPAMSSRGKDLTDALLQRCTACGLNGEAEPHIGPFIHRLRRPVPLPPPATRAPQDQDDATVPLQDEEVAIDVDELEAIAMAEAVAAAPLMRRVVGKQSPATLLEASPALIAGGVVDSDAAEASAPSAKRARRSADGGS